MLLSPVPTLSGVQHVPTKAIRVLIAAPCVSMGPACVILVLLARMACVKFAQMTALVMANAKQVSATATRVFLVRKYVVH